MFNAGDRVMCISPPDGAQRFVGKAGTVKSYRERDRLSVHVNFESREFWFCEENSLRLYDESGEQEFWREVKNNV